MKRRAFSGFALILALACCGGLPARAAAASAGQSSKNAELSPAQATLSSINFDRDALAAEALSAVKSKGRTEVIVTLAQPDLVPKAEGKSEAQHLGEFRARNHAAAADALTRLSADDFQERNRFENFAGFTGTVSEQGLQKLLADPSVKFVEPIRILEPHLAQGIPLMNATTVRSSYNGSGLSIAVCDTGIDYTHARLGGGGFPNAKVLGGYDYGDNDANPMPNTQAHGTCCAGIAAGDTGTVGDYIGGVAYNAKLYALKISSGTTGSATDAAMISAWDWCVTHKNDNPSYPIMVISTSFGGGRYYSTATGDAYSPAMTTAANNAVAAGITVLASSGNDGYCDSMGWPACISSVFSVGAVYDASLGTYGFCVDAASCATKVSYTSCDTGYLVWDSTAADKVTCYSNSASFLTLLAPSHDCTTLDIAGASGYSTGDYDTTFGGTSAACPYAAGAVACLQSAAKATLGRWLTVAEVRSTLTSTGASVTDSKVAITKPRINLGAAVALAATLPSVEAFAWAPVSSPQPAGAPFGVTVTALKGTGATASDFNSTVSLSGTIPGLPGTTIGTGTASANFPMGTYYHDERTQVIYLASEIGGAQTINSLSLYVGTPPGQVMNAWTIRMKHTTLSAFSPASWEGSGWTTVYQANQTVSASGWVQFNFSTPFSYNGVNNLMIDFSFNNSSYTTDGTCRYSTPGGNRTMYKQTDSGYGDPLTWSGSSPAATRTTYVPNIRIGGTPDTPVSITPTVSGSFVNGVWTGNITVPGGATGMFLRADDGSGHKGDSNTFNVVADTTPPTVTSISAPSTTLTRTGPVTYTVNFSEVVTGFDAAADIQLNTTGSPAPTATVAVSGSGSGPYTVTLNPVGGNGTIGITVKAASCTDTAGNGNTVSGASATFTVDNTAPTITSISAPSTTLARTGPVTYTVNFSEVVTGFDAAADIQLNTTGSPAPTATVAVTGSGSGPYTVTLNPVGGNGTIGIIVKAASCTDTAGNGNTVSGASATFAVDNTAPTITSISAPSTTLTRTGPVTYTVNFSEVVTGFDTASDIQLNTTGSPAPTATVAVTGSGSGPYTVTLNPVGGNGTIGITVKAASCADTAGNGNTVSGASATFAVDNTAPTITSISAPSTALIRTGPVTYTVNFSEAVTGFDAASDIQLNTTGSPAPTATVTVTGSGAGPYTVTLNPVGGNGTIGITVKTASCTDTAGNGNTVSGASATFTVDNAPPVITVLGANPATAECGATYADAGATASDSVAGNLTASIVVSNPVNTAVLAAYTVRYNVTDGIGNNAVEVTRTVNVVDTVAPAISLNGSASVTVECGATYGDAGATASDACAGSPAVTTTGTVDAAVVGVYTLTYSASDGVNAATEVTRVVTVSDTVKPTITLLGGTPVEVERISTYSDAGATASDTCAGGLAVTTTGTVNTSLVGSYALTYSATDGHNAAEPVTRVVNVVQSDVTPPVITTCAPDRTLLTDATCGIVVPDLSGEVSATDDVTPSGSLVITQNPAAGATLTGLDAQTVTITVADAVNNTATCDVTLTPTAFDYTATIPTVLPWAVTGNAVYAMAATPTTLYVGGNFAGAGPVGSVPASGWTNLAKIDLATGAVDATWQPVVESGEVVRALVLSTDGTTLYLATSGTSGHVDALDVATKVATRLTEQPNYIYALAVSEGYLYFGGATFGASRYLGEINLSTSALVWVPSASVGATVTALAPAGNTLYVGLAASIKALDMQTLAATAFCTTNGAVKGLAASCDAVYAGGAFTTIGGETRTGLAVLDSAGVVETGWVPVTNGAVNVLCGTESSLYGAGAFTTVDGYAFPGLVRFANSAAPTVTVNQASGQIDPAPYPTTGTPIQFTVLFSEAVTGFTAGDVTWGGTITGPTVVITGSGASYTINATSTAGATGTLIPAIAAGRCQGAAGNYNAASTGTDNSVTVAGAAPSSFAVSAPSAGAYWARGTMHDITWNGALQAGNASIQLYDYNGTAATNPNYGTYAELASGIPAVAGAWSWTVPAGQASGANYKIRVVSPTAAGISAAFEVGPDTAFIRITSHNTGSNVFAPGSTVTVNWWSYKVTGTVNLFLYDYQDSDSSPTNSTLVTGIPVANGTASWTIPAGHALGGMYKFRVAQTTALSDFNDVFCAIGAGAPSLLMTSPNGGETWTRGTTQAVAFTTNAVADKVVLQVWNYATGASTTITPVTGGVQGVKPARDGNNTFSWTIPPGFATGVKYKMRVVTRNGALNDFSNGYFTIN